MLEAHINMPSIGLLFLAVNTGLTVLIWLIQLIVYPSMAGWDQASFSTFHQKYTRNISLIVIPLMVMQLLLGLLQTFFHYDSILMTQLFFIDLAWGVTLFVFLPIHRKLSTDFDEKIIHKLIKTNWIRTTSWSLVSLIDWLDIYLIV